jgi:hypothetical protein
MNSTINRTFAFPVDAFLNLLLLAGLLAPCLWAAGQ